MFEIDKFLFGIAFIPQIYFFIILWNIFGVTRPMHRLKQKTLSNGLTVVVHTWTPRVAAIWMKYDFFLGYFDPENRLFMLKWTGFPGYLTNTSAKTKTLAGGLTMVVDTWMPRVAAIWMKEDSEDWAKSRKASVKEQLSYNFSAEPIRKSLPCISSDWSRKYFFDKLNKYSFKVNWPILWL